MGIFSTIKFFKRYCEIKKVYSEKYGKKQNVSNFCFYRTFSNVIGTGASISPQFMKRQNKQAEDVSQSFIVYEEVPENQDASYKEAVDQDSVSDVGAPYDSMTIVLGKH